MQDFNMLAQYNRWANQKLYAACAELSEADIVKDRCAFFGNILNTLNHILVGDRLWMARVTGEPVPAGTKLDTVLFSNFSKLRDARELEDYRIMEIIRDLSSTQLENNLYYKNVAGEDCSEPLWQILTHVFNHGTHHRGQVHGMLSQTKVSPPPLDLIYYLRS